MKRGAGKSSRRRLLRLATGLGVLFLVTGWVASRTWYPEHIRRVTGRSDVSRVSCLHCHRAVEPPIAGVSTDGYISPAGMAVSPDGTKLYVAAPGVGRLLEVDLATQRIARAVESAHDRPEPVRDDHRDGTSR